MIRSFVAKTIHILIESETITNRNKSIITETNQFTKKIIIIILPLIYVKQLGGVRCLKVS